MMCTSLNLTGESEDYKFPFMLSNVNYARHFEDQLSFFLRNVINQVDLTKEGSTNSLSDEDQRDLRNLLSHMQEYSEQYSQHFAMVADLLYCYCVFLKNIANQLAHKVYNILPDQETGSSSHVVGKVAYIEVYLEYGCDLAMQIIQGTDQVLN